MFASVLLASAIVAGVVAVGFHRASALPTGREGAPASRAVIILVDGATPADFALATLPNLRGLIRHGAAYANAWVGQLQPYSVASAATIGTGVFPRSHGILGPEWTDPQTARPTTALVPSQVELGSVDQLMESHGVSSLAERVKSADPRNRVLAVGGVTCAAAAAAGTWLADYVLCPARDGNRWVPASVAGHRPPTGSLTDISWTVPVAQGSALGPAVEGWTIGTQDDWIARYAAAAIQVTKPNLAIIDFPEAAQVMPYVDAVHRKQIVRRLMVAVDRGIGRIEAELRRQGVLRRTVFVVTSTDAVTPLIDTVSGKQLNSALVKAGADRTYLTSDGMAALGLADPVQAEPVSQAIQGERISTIDAIYSRVHSGNRWSYQPQYLSPQLPAGFGDAASYLLGTVASSSSPDVIAAYAPGVGSEGHIRSYLRTGIVSGFHWSSQHIPLVISGQGVFPSISSAYPARLVDIAPTVEAMLGLEPARQAGTILADCMYNPPSDATDRQKHEANALDPLVLALKQRTASQG